MYFVLFYEYVPDVLEKRTPYRPDYLSLAKEAHEAGRTRPAMPIHVPAPTHLTNKCPKCSAEGVVQQVENMTSYARPTCNSRWVATG